MFFKPMSAVARGRAKRANACKQGQARKQAHAYHHTIRKPLGRTRGPGNCWRGQWVDLVWPLGKRLRAASAEGEARCDSQVRKPNDASAQDRQQ